MFDWITSVVSESGYPGIVGLMFAENIFPPIPSELIMPLAGFVAAQGKLNPVLVVLAGTLGSVLGALPWYYLGLWLGRERICALAARHGRWLTLDERDVGKAIDWFEKHGGKAVLLGRLVPTVRTLISVPAGMARMPLLPFLAYSAIGTLAWTALLTAAGYLLKSEYQVVGRYVDAASKIIIGLIVLTYLYRLLRGGRLGAAGPRVGALAAPRRACHLSLGPRPARALVRQGLGAGDRGLRGEPDRPDPRLHPGARPARRCRSWCRSPCCWRCA